MRDDDLRIPPPGYRSAPQRRAEEMRRMLYICGGAATIVLLAVIAYFVATGGGGSGGMTVIQPPATPVKVKPADPGGLAVTNQGSGLLTNGSSSAVAPAPETPDPAALAAAAKQEQQASTPPKPAPAPVTPPPPAPAPAAPAAAPAVSIPSVPETPAKHSSHDMAMTVPPPSRQAAKTHDLAQEYRPSAPAVGHHGPVQVQLAALDSRDAALHEWDHLSHRMPDLFAGRRPIIVSATINGHTWWRVRTAGFSSGVEAEKFCRDVRAHGGACNVASF